MLGFQPKHLRDQDAAAPAKGPGLGFRPGHLRDQLAAAAGQGLGFHPEHLRNQQAAAPVKGSVPGQGRADSVPAMLTPEEYVLPTDTVNAVGKENLDALLEQTHTPKPVDARVPRGFHPKLFLANGGSVEDAGRKVAPYVNHRPPNGPPATPAQPLLGNSVPPQTGLQNTYRPNFTMGGNDAVPPARPAGPDVSDVRAKYNPANGSPEARAWQAQRTTANTAATAAAPAAATTPAAATAPQGLGYRAGAAIGRSVAPILKAAGSVALPATLAGTAGAVSDTPTSDYEKRFGFEPNTTEGVGGLARDVGVRALGAASDLGDVLTLGVAGKYLYADKQANPAGVEPGVDSTANAGAEAGAGRGTENPAPVNPSAPAPALSPASTLGAGAPSSDVTRVGSSYSGTNVAGDITINGQAPRNGGQISAQNMAAADALAVRNAGPGGARGFLPPHLRDAGAGATGSSTVGLGFQPEHLRNAVAAPAPVPGPGLGFSGTIGQSGGNGNMWSRTPEQQRRDAETQASSIHRPTAARGGAALQNLNVQDALATREAGETGRAQLRDAGETGRTQMREEGAGQRAAGALGLGFSRLGAERARLDIERSRAASENQARGFSLRAAERLDGLQQAYASSTDETKRAQLARQIREVQGKVDPSKWKGIALQGGTDAMGNKTESVLAAVNEGTGEMRQGGAAQGGAPKLPVVGAVESGYRFKGGDPANPASWEKE